MGSNTSVISATNQQTISTVFPYVHPWNNLAINAIINAEKSDISVTQYNTNIATNNVQAANQNLTDANNFSAAGYNLIADAIDPSKVVTSIQTADNDITTRANTIINRFPSKSSTDPQFILAVQAIDTLKSVRSLLNNYATPPDLTAQANIINAIKILMMAYLYINNAEWVSDPNQFKPPLKSLIPNIVIPQVGGNKVMYGGKPIHQCGASCAIHRYYIQKILS
jgi:hypothetical protein